MNIKDKICAFLRESALNTTKLGIEIGLNKNIMHQAKQGKIADGETLIIIARACLKYGMTLKGYQTAQINENNELILARLIEQEYSPEGEYLQVNLRITRLPFWQWANFPDF